MFIPQARATTDYTVHGQIQICLQHFSLWSLDLKKKKKWFQAGLEALTQA